MKIRDLKCCGNCKLYLYVDGDYDGDFECSLKGDYAFHNRSCNYWEWDRKIICDRLIKSPPARPESIKPDWIQIPEEDKS